MMDTKKIAFSKDIFRYIGAVIFIIAAIWHAVAWGFLGGTTIIGSLAALVIGVSLLIKKPALTMVGSGIYIAMGMFSILQRVTINGGNTCSGIIPQDKSSRRLEHLKKLL